MAQDLAPMPVTLNIFCNFRTKTPSAFTSQIEDFKICDMKAEGVLVLKMQNVIIRSH